MKELIMEEEKERKEVPEGGACGEISKLMGRWKSATNLSVA
jgi:hypothetical protein